MPRTAHVSPYSGSWYPADVVQLKDLLARLWRGSEERTGCELQPRAAAFVVPHAGLIYSGVVAAAVYRRLQAWKPRRVLLLGFSHRGGPAGIAIPDTEAYRTPLGELEVDREVVADLAGFEPFRLVEEPVVCDHSVEIQLPLLQRAAPEAKLVPLYVGDLSGEARERAAVRLAPWIGPDTVALASSDFTHFGAAFYFQPFPVDGEVSERLRELDYKVVDAASSLRDTFFFEVLRETRATVCGYAPIGLLLATLRQFDDRDEVFQDLLDYQTSGEITGDFHHSVSYAALAYYSWSSLQLSPQEQAALLELAQNTLRRYQETGSRRPSVPEMPPLAGLGQCRAAFVTLHKNGELRGCLGRSVADRPLWEVIPELTLAAALEDRRFPPLERDESGIEVEISILSPLKRIPDQSGFRIHEHGALLNARGHQGLLLPQVATGRGWDAERFFQALAVKAGVSPDVYSDPSTRLYVFRAQIIH
jgi:AmmeMemoRadiSam system protein B/AmmeMemoRadiSam system protein A